MTSTANLATPAKMETARQGLILRHLEDNDAAQMQRLVERNDAYLRCTLNWLDMYSNRDGALNFIRFCRAEYENGKGCNLVMELDGQPVGICGYRWIDAFNRNGEISYWLDETAQGQGIVTTCCQRLMDLGFDEWGFNRICFTVLSTNEPSKRIIYRLGARYEGLMRGRLWFYDHFEDLELHSILASDR